MPYFALFLLLTLVGCKSSDSNENSFGPEIDISEVITAQEKVLGIADPQKIEKNDFAYFLKTQEAYSSQQPVSFLMEEEGITVTDREDYPDHFNIIVVREVIDHMQEDSPHFKYKDIYSVLKNTKQKPLPGYDPQSLNLKTNSIEKEDSTSKKMSFHNLQVRDIKMSRPTKVIEKDPCPEGLDCRLNAKQLTYDIVLQEGAQKPEKNQIELIVSPDVPYFASVLKSCVSTIIVVDNSQPLLRQCKFIQDYQ